MSAELPLSGPNAEPPQIDEVIRLTNRNFFMQFARIFAMETAVVTAAQSRYIQYYNGQTGSSVDLEYFAEEGSTRDRRGGIPSEAFEKVRVAFPLVRICVYNEGLYHSSVGDVPLVFIAEDGNVYQSANHFIFDITDQAYRQDQLTIQRKFPFAQNLPNLVNSSINAPRETDLGYSFHSLEPGDYEMIGSYLHQIDSSELQKSQIEFL
jgi:hypothetical protein